MTKCYSKYSLRAPWANCDFWANTAFREGSRRDFSRRWNSSTRFAARFLSTPGKGNERDVCLALSTPEWVRSSLEWAARRRIDDDEFCFCSLVGLKKAVL